MYGVTKPASNVWLMFPGAVCDEETAISGNQSVPITPVPRGGSESSASDWPTYASLAVVAFCAVSLMP